LVFRWYEAIRRLGFDVDFVPPGATLENYRLVLAPSLPIICRKAGLSTTELPAEVRLRRRGDLTFAFNYGETRWRAPFSDEPLLGEPEVIPRNFTVWRS